MSGFTTPGRQGVSNVAGGGTSGRRVVRSALELLVDTASPDLFRHSSEQQVFKENQKSKESNQKLPQSTKPAFTVTRTTAPPPPLPPPVEVESVSTQKGWAAKGEPSTLLFLSPRPTVRADAYLSPTNTLDPRRESNVDGRDSTVKKRLFKKKKKVKLSDSVKKLATRDACSTVLLDESFSHAESDSDPICDTMKDSTQFTHHSSHRKPIHIDNTIPNERMAVGRAVSSSPLLRTNEPLFTEDEVRARVADALSAYEKRRDAEEECVLQEVGREIESQNTRYDTLQRESAVVSAERDALLGEVSSLAAQREALQSTVHALHTALEEERGKLRRAEVELCHAQDERRLQSNEMQQELSFEKAQWRLAQDEMRRRIDEFASQLQDRTREWEAQREAIAEGEAERARLSAQLEERDTAIRRAKEANDKHEAAARQAQQHMREVRAELEGRLAEANEAIRQSKEDMRRHTQRIYAMEKETARATAAATTAVGESAQKIMRDAAERIGAVEAALQSLARRAAANVKSAVIVSVEEEEGEEEEEAVDDAICRYSHNPKSYYNVCFEGVDTTALPAPATTAAVMDDGDNINNNDNNSPCDDDSVLALVRSDALRAALRGDRKGLRPRAAKGLRPWLPAAKPTAAKSEKTAKPAEKAIDNSADTYRAAIARAHELCMGHVDTLSRVLLQQLQRIAHRRRLEKKECAAATESARLARLDLQAANEQRRCHEARVAALERERGLLAMQLDASQRDCVELREREETARADADALQQRLSTAEDKLRITEDKLRITEDKLRTAEDQLRTGSEELRTAEEKTLGRLARLSERVKKSEAAGEVLRGERDTLSRKVNELLLQLQTLRIHQQQQQQQQRNRTAQPVKEKEIEKEREKEREKEKERQKQERDSHRAELATLRKELSALRALRDSGDSRHAKEREELEASRQELRDIVDKLRADQSQLQRSIALLEDTAAAQREGEVAALRTLLDILRDAAEPAAEACHVRQRLFDSTPCGKETQIVPEQSDTGAMEMRYRAVSLAQRAVLELVRLREVVTLAPLVGAEPKAIAESIDWEKCRADAFLAAERHARESAERSAARRVCLSRPMSVPRTEQRDPRQQSPMHSPPWQQLQQLLGGGTPRAVSSLSSQSTAGVSRSRSRQGDVDGSRSPARPPVLRALSLR